VSKNSYLWSCPDCGTELELKKRVTQGKRSCPECGTIVTTDEIDRQSALRSVVEIARQKTLWESEMARSNALRGEELARQNAQKTMTLLFSLLIAGIVIFILLRTSSQQPAAEYSASAPSGNSALNSRFIPAPETVDQLHSKSTSNNDSPPPDSLLVAERNTPKEQMPSGDPVVTRELPIDSELTSSPLPIESQSVSNENWSLDPSIQVVQSIDKAIGSESDQEDNQVNSILAELSVNVPVGEQCTTEGTTQFNKAGLNALEMKHYAEAANYFVRAIQVDRTDPKLLSNLAFAQTYIGNLDSAKKNLSQSLSLAPKRAVAWDDLGQVFAKQHEQHKAVACFLIALKVSGGETLTYLKLLDKDNDVAVRLAAALALQQTSR
jgi:predicted RNA-binding Zn-ribbon protein involved in translation (DUF1610 family)